MPAPHLITLPNFRDLGGLAAADGRRVVENTIFRSVELGRLSEDDRETLDGVGLRTIVDLRTTAERSSEPDVLPDGAEETHLDILAGMQAGTHSAGPEQLGELFKDPQKASQLLGGGVAEQMLSGAYVNLVKLPSALDGYRQFLRLLDGEQTTPLLFHCTTGKDRTGWAAAITLTLLGVARDDVISDYLRTNDELLPALKMIFDKFAAGGGDPDLLRPVLGVERSYIELAFSTVDETYGSFDSYLTGGLGVDDAMRTRLIGRYTA